MGTAKRERQKANRQQRLAELQRQQVKEKRKRTVTKWVVIGVGGTAALIGLAFLLNRGGGSSTAATTTTTTVAGGSSTSSAVSTVPAPTTVPGETLTGDTPCPPAEGAKRTTKFAKEPPMCIDPAKTYTAKVETTKGPYTIALDAKSAPKTVNNFVVLSRYGYYDGTPCHRILKGFMAQCGDPTGKGNGGPGYTFADELPKGSGVYKKGVVAMANAGANTNGSQFFTMLDDKPALPSNYSVFGTVGGDADSQATLAALNAVGAASDPSPPAEPVYISRITITES